MANLLPFLGGKEKKLKRFGLYRLMYDPAVTIARRENPACIIYGLGDVQKLRLHKGGGGSIRGNIVQTI